MEGRYIDRAELVNRLASVNTYDNEYRAAVYQIIQAMDGFERVNKIHDLRKNKDDLPDSNGDYLIYYTMNCEAYKKVYPYVDSYNPDYGWNAPSQVEVVAWKEIEPLES